MLDYIVDETGKRSHVHREYVDVIVRFDRNGLNEPVKVIWHGEPDIPLVT